jgi:hypothetical protein
MKQSEAIALIHAPYFPDNARIDTMPFVLNSLRQLAAAGWPVDVFLWEQAGDRYTSLFPHGVTLHYQRSPLHDPRTAESFQQGPGYRCVFGVGQMGAYAAAIVAQRNGCPLVLLNNEFPSQWGAAPLAQAEATASARATLLVVPDPCRIEPLLRELHLSSDKPCVALPNGPPDLLPATNDDWHARLGIEPGAAICLNAGSLADFAQLPELMTTVPMWPDRSVLVLNERNRNRLEQARQTFAHLEFGKRIVWNPASLTESDLHSLVAAAALNFALYRNSGPNIEYAGFSSGKLMRSLAAGVPVVASRLASFQFIEKYALGKLVHHPMEIPAAIAAVLERRDEYAANCRTYYRDNCRFDPYWAAFCDRLNGLSGLDLRRGPANSLPG